MTSSENKPVDTLNEIGVLKRREIEARILAPLLDAFGRDPKIKLTRTQTIMQGAPFCDFRYAMEKQGE